MNPNPKIESYLDCGHELVCKPRTSTTEGPAEAHQHAITGAHAARQAAASALARGPLRTAHQAAGGAGWRHARTRTRASCWALQAPTPRRQAGPAHEARRRRLTARAQRTRTRPAAAGPRGGGLRAALGGARPARSARGSWRCRRPDRSRMLPGPHQCCSVQHAAASRWRPARPRMRHRRPQLQERCALARAAAPCGMRTAGGGRTRRTAARAAAARD